jgi:hypothetical protein
MFQVKSKQKTKAMGVLDIYGFEVFEVSFFFKLNFNTKSTSIDWLLDNREICSKYT